MKSISLISFLSLGLAAAGEATFKTVGRIAADFPTVQATIAGRVAWAKASADSPPAGFGREIVLGDWNP